MAGAIHEYSTKADGFRLRLKAGLYRLKATDSKPFLALQAIMFKKNVMPAKAGIHLTGGSPISKRRYFTRILHDGFRLKDCRNDEF